jgi:hypothetical protein
MNESPHKLMPLLSWNRLSIAELGAHTEEIHSRALVYIHGAFINKLHAAKLEATGGKIHLC